MTDSVFVERLQMVEDYIAYLKREDFRIARAVLGAFGPDALFEEQRRILLDSGSELSTQQLAIESEFREGHQE